MEESSEEVECTLADSDTQDDIPILDEVEVASVEVAPPSSELA